MADDTKTKLELTRKAAKDEGDSKRGKGKKQESRQYIKFYMASNTHLHMTTHTHTERHTYALAHACMSLSVTLIGFV